MSEILKAIDGADGYCLRAMDPGELARLREFIRDQWLTHILYVAPEAAAEFAALETMDQYHLLAEKLEHSKIWPKKARVLGPAIGEQILGMEFMKAVREELGEYEVSDEENFGWGEIYWRLVRPGGNDIGSLHADSWFYDDPYYEGNEAGYRQIKIWISIFTVPGLSGLSVIPGSHQKADWNYHLDMSSGRGKPVFDEDPETLDVLKLSMDPGELILFHFDLVHGGMVNESDKTRVSLEMTLLVKDSRVLN